MRQSQKVSLIVVAFLILLSLYGLYPSLVYHSMSHEEQETLKAEDPTEYYSLKNKALRLGLDLKGGMHIVLEVEKPEEGRVTDVQDRVLEIIRNRVDKIGVTEPQIQTSGTNRIVVDLPGFTDIEQAAYPEVYYLIVSLNTKGVLELRGFSMPAQDGAIHEKPSELELSIQG